LIQAEPPVGDQPTGPERKALKGCDSEALYYGIGIAADPVKARKCAIIEREQHPDQTINYFTAEGVLMTVYANGRGANRNFDVAIHMACQLQDAPAAIDGRVKHLVELKQKAWTGSAFSPCEDATSGLSGGLCADHNAALAQQDRRLRIQRLARNWTPQQRVLFDRTYKSFTDYADTAHEMDCWHGTLQAGCTISAREYDVERFLKRIESLSAGRIPKKEAPPEDAGTSAATTSAADWKEFLSSLDKDDRIAYEQNGRETLSSRRRFEQNLVSFARSALPRFTSHQIRQIFSDL
jgi:hypothetical protein